MAEMVLALGDKNYSSWSLRPWLAMRQAKVPVVFAPVVSRFRTYGIPLHGAAQSYEETIWTLPAMQDWVAAAKAETFDVPEHDRR